MIMKNIVLTLLLVVVAKSFITGCGQFNPLNFNECLKCSDKYYLWKGDCFDCNGWENDGPECQNTPKDSGSSEVPLLVGTGSPSDTSSTSTQTSSSTTHPQTTASATTTIQTSETQTQQQSDSVRTDNMKLLMGMLPQNCVYFTFKNGGVVCKECNKGYQLTGNQCLKKVEVNTSQQSSSNEVIATGGTSQQEGTTSTVETNTGSTQTETTTVLSSGTSSETVTKPTNSQNKQQQQTQSPTVTTFTGTIEPSKEEHNQNQAVTINIRQQSQNATESQTVTSSNNPSSTINIYQPDPQTNQAGSSQPSTQPTTTTNQQPTIQTTNQGGSSQTGASQITQSPQQSTAQTTNQGGSSTSNTPPTTQTTQVSQQAATTQTTSQGVSSTSSTPQAPQTTQQSTTQTVNQGVSSTSSTPQTTQATQATQTVQTNPQSAITQTTGQNLPSQPIQQSSQSSSSTPVVIKVPIQPKYPNPNQPKDLNCLRYSTEFSLLQPISTNNRRCFGCFPSFYYNVSLQICMPKNPLCRQCDDNNICQSCYPGYILMSGDCVINDGRIPQVVSSSGQGQLNSQGLNCQEYNADGNCKKCASRYFFDSSIKTCIQVDPSCRLFNPVTGNCDSCYTGYTVDTANERRCLRVDKPITTGSTVVDPNKYKAYCSSFISGTCSQCVTRYFLFNGLCFPVSDLCRTYNPNFGFCMTCYDGYSLVDGVCKVSTSAAAHDPFCVALSAIGCGECISSYYPKDGKCTPVSVLCHGYNKVNGHCTACFAPYTVNISTGACQFIN